MTACPKVPETYHLIGEAELAIMKKTAYLVSVTRGSIIGEQTLIVALKGGQLLGPAWTLLKWNLYHLTVCCGILPT